MSVLDFGVQELARVFGNEFVSMARDDRFVVFCDFCDMALAEGETYGLALADEYARRIGKGNLQRYAECLRPRLLPDGRLMGAA